MEKILNEIPLELLTNGHDEVNSRTSISDTISGKNAIGLYFASLQNQSRPNFTQQLAAIYKQMSPKMPFDIIFVSYDKEQKDFDENYKQMPWKSLPFNEELAQTLRANLTSYYNIEFIPSLFILKSDGNILTKNGCKGIEHLGLKATESWCSGQNKVNYTQILEPNNQFIWSGVPCDECDQELTGTIYYCETCGTYDICETCEKSEKHPHELRIFIPPPCDYIETD
jgi:hypothetical protein